MMDRAISRQYSVCSLLLLLTFSLVYNQEFSTNVNAWVDHCILHTNYTAPAGNDTCSAYRYRVNVNMYTRENKRIQLSTTDTNDLKYSYNGINSFTRYGIEVTPALQCLNMNKKHFPWGETSTKNVTASAETSNQTVLAAEAENLSISCPFHGAYKSYTVIKWQHRLGINNIVIRNFTTATVNLVNITYVDSGMYYCKVEYYPCGSSSRGPMYKEGYVAVNFEGPPVIASVMRTTEGYNISLAVLVVSFPQPPWPTITLANENGHKIEVNSSGFAPVVFQYTAYGQSVNVSGFETKITIRNISVEWLGEIKVFVTNRHGTQEYTVTTTSNDREKKKTLEAFFNENKLLVYGVGAGFLILFSLGIAVLIGCDKHRKKKQRRGLNVNDTQEKDIDSLALVDELYARPFSNKLYEDIEDGAIPAKVPDREK